MEEGDELVDRANALIRRQRSSVAPFVAAVRRPPAAGDDLPLLTEVVEVEAEAIAEGRSLRHDAGDEAFSQALIQIVAAELSRSIEHRLSIELPSLVEATLATLQEDLGRGIVAATEAALRDFLSRNTLESRPKASPPADNQKA